MSWSNKAHLGAWLRVMRLRMGPLWFHAGALFAAARIGDLVAMYVGLFYLPRALSPADLGAVEPLTRLVGLTGIPLAVLAFVVPKYLSSYCAQHESGKVKRMIRDLWVLSLGGSIVAAGLIGVVLKPLCVRMHLHSGVLYAAVLSLVVVSFWQPVLNFALQGTRRFLGTMMSGLIGAFSRLVFAVLLVPLFALAGYLWALVLSGLAGMLGGAVALRPFLSSRIPARSYYDDLRGMVAFSLPVLGYVAGCALQGFLEPFIINHRLPSMDAAGYYMVCRFGNIPTYLIGSVLFVLYPLVSHWHERGEATAPYLRQALLMAIPTGACLSIALWLGGDCLFGMLDAWKPYRGYAHFAWLAALVATLDTLVAILAMHEIACRRLEGIRVVALCAVCECAFLYGSFGWAWFHGKVPEGLWETLHEALSGVGLGYVFSVMILTRAVEVAVLFGVYASHPAVRQSDGSSSGKG